MKVKELIEKLSKVDQELEVYYRSYGFECNYLWCTETIKERYVKLNSKGIATITKKPLTEESKNSKKVAIIWD